MLDGLDLLIPALDFSLVSFPDLMGTGEVGLIGSPCSSPLYDKYVNFRKLLQLRETYEFKDTQSPAIIRQQLNAAHAQRKEVKANATAHSYEYRTRLADQMATEGNTTREQHLQNLN